MSGDDTVNDMNELVDWLRAQIDEDERLAREATGGEWEVGPNFGARDNRVYVREVGDLIDSVGTCVIACQVSNMPQFRANARFIAANDPARVLAEVQSKRQLIDECAFEVKRATVNTPQGDLAAFVLKTLALAYRDREGYRTVGRGRTREQGVV